MNNTSGIFYILAAMALFSIEDAIIKILTTMLPVGQIMMLLGTLGGTAFLLIGLIRRDPIWARENWSAVCLIRAGLEGASALTFATALSKVELSTVAAVFQTTPLVTMAAAALFLGEKIGWRRAMAIVMGFVGVLMIVRPGLEGFQPAAIWVLGTVVTISARDVITRGMNKGIPSSVISFQAFYSLVPVGAILLAIKGDAYVSPDATSLQYAVGAATFGVVGYFGLVKATRIGETAVIMPFRYARLVFSIIVGFFLFAERPDAMMLLGSALIIGSGLYSYLRERQTSRRDTTHGAA